MGLFQQLKKNQTTHRHAIKKAGFNPVQFELDTATDHLSNDSLPIFLLMKAFPNHFLSFTFFCCALMLAACGGNAPVADDLDKLANELEAKASETHEYNLEQTVRVIYALEEGPSRLKDFDAYTQFLATYDYAGVAPDVIAAQAFMMPVVREMRAARADKESNESAWQAFQDFQGPAQLAVSGAISALGADPVSATMSILKAGKGAMGAASERHKRDEAVAKKLDAASQAYTTYLEKSSAAFLKYMKEWDAFCVVRDQAYLSIHHGDYAAAETLANQALDMAPNDRESMLLKVYSTLMKPAALAAPDSPELTSSSLQELESMMDRYLQLYPGQSAPGLLLQGMLAARAGNESRAMTLFDEAALMYPKQAELLLDMVNPYKARGYFGTSVESEFVLELYKSTMEGFGAFSPNFQKAAIYLNKGDVDAAQEEIRMHFFRRGGQVVQDYLPTDLIFCQQELPEAINSLLVENSFLDISIEEGGVMDKDNSLFANIANHSSRNLENVRLYLCIHFTETYRNTYEVFEVPGAIRAIGPFEAQSFDDPAVVEFEWKGQPKEVLKDVVHIRGVLVTDDIVAWVDSDDFKLKRAQEAIDAKRNVSPELQAIAEGAELDFEEGYVYTTGTVRFDRALIQLNPYVSLNEMHLPDAVYPREKRITADYIEYRFKTTDALEDLPYLHLSTDKGSVKIPLRSQPA